MPEVPISTTRWRVSSSASSSVRETPRRLLKLFGAAATAHSEPRISLRNSLVVVFPTLPVIAVTSKSSSWRWQSASASRAASVSATRTTQRPGSRGTSRLARLASAPCSKAPWMNSCPSKRSPLNGMKSSPGSTFLLSVEMPVTIRSSEPAVSRLPPTSEMISERGRGLMRNKPLSEIPRLPRGRRNGFSPGC